MGEIRVRRIWNSYIENLRRFLEMFHKFEGNWLNFGILYGKNRISRIL